MKQKFNYMTIGALLALIGLVSLFALFANRTQAQQNNAWANQMAQEETNIVSHDSEQTNNPTSDFADRVQIHESIVSTHSENTIVSESHEDNKLFQVLEINADTQDNPQQEYVRIIQQVQNLNEKYIVNLSHEFNWLHVQYHTLVPVSTRGTGTLPDGTHLSNLYPTDTTVDDYWFSKDDYSIYIHHVSDLSGTLLQKAASIHGETVNLTLMAAGLATYRYPTSLEAEYPSLQGRSLSILRELKDSEKFTAWLENGQYVVTVVDYFDQAIQFGNVANPLMAHRYQIVFDWETGAIQYEEFAFQTIEGEWLIMEARTQFVYEEQYDLPAEALQTMEQLLNLIQEEN